MLLYLSSNLTSTQSYIKPRQLGHPAPQAMRTPGRSATPRGPLLATERAIIDLFEKARASVTYISTQSRVVDAWTRNVAASLVGVSPAHDLAVLKVTLDRMPPPLPLGTSHDLRVG